MEDKLSKGIKEIFKQDEIANRQTQFKKDSIQYTIYLTQQNDEQIEVLSKKMHTTRSAVVSLIIDKYAPIFEKEISKIL